jgi:hypothetical protein
MGARLPFLYFLPGAAADTFGINPISALNIARLVSGSISVALLLLAVWLCWDGSRASLLGPLLAMGPAVLWISAQLNPNGPEVAAGVLLAAAAVRLGRDPSGLGVSWWMATAFGAVVLAAARPFGPVWLLAYIALFFLEARPRGVAQAVRRHSRTAVGVLAAVTVALVANIWWQMQVPPAGLAATTSSLLGAVGPALASVPETIGEEIGVFGADDILMPRWSYALWGTALLLVVGLALLKGKRRDVRSLEIAIVGSFAIRWALAVLFIPTTGQALQGRHVLPVTVAVAILAGEAINRNRLTIPRLGQLVAVVAALVLTVQAVAWSATAHRFAAGQDGSWWLFSGPAWAPPGGWLPGAVLMAAGVVAIGLSLLPRSNDEAQLANLK